LLISKRAAYADCAFNGAVSDNWQTTTHPDIGRSLSGYDRGGSKAFRFEWLSVARVSASGCSNRFSNGPAGSLGKYSIHALVRDQV
jgi:hypothetical protein